MKYPICCITDESYAQYCGVMICSLLENNVNKSFLIRILTSELNGETRQKLMEMIQLYGSECIFHQIDESRLIGIQGIQTKGKFSNYTTYYKLLLSSVIDTETKIILYLDSDVIVNGDITHIFDLDISKCALAAVEDTPIDNSHREHLSLPYGSRYFNAGVMLVNLEYWRKNDGEARLLRFVEKEKYIFFHDQDALNVVFRDQWFVLHPIWNKFHIYAEYHPYFATWRDNYIFKTHPLIIHYASNLKPWYSLHFLPYKREYRKFLKMTPWRGTKPLKFRNNKAAYLYIFIHACRGTPLQSILLWILKLRDRIRG
jgi:lipopolysaccharide biosynthesis glycosyltransferase